MNVSAAILAGGKSSRFGSDKALHIYKGKMLLQWVLDSFKEMDDVFIIANREYSQFKLPGYKDIVNSRGPLVGILTAIEYAKHDWVAVAACDMPFLTGDYWQLLLSERKDCRAVIVKSAGGLQPMAALYHKSIKAEIEARLSKDNYSVQDLLKLTRAKILDGPQLKIAEQTFANINYKNDLNLL